MCIAYLVVRPRNARDTADRQVVKFLEQAAAQVQAGAVAAGAGVDNSRSLGDAAGGNGDDRAAERVVVRVARPVGRHHVLCKSDDCLVLGVGVSARAETNGVVGNVTSVDGARCCGSRV